MTPAQELLIAEKFHGDRCGVIAGGDCSCGQWERLEPIDKVIDAAGGQVDYWGKYPEYRPPMSRVATAILDLRKLLR